MSDKELSFDAKAVLGTVFQHGMTLSFQMVESRPTARMSAALDELLAAGLIVKDDIPKRANGRNGVTYKARVPTESYRRFASKAKGLILAEPTP